MLENVLAQTTSVAAATLPLTAGFAGIVPAFALLSGGPPALSIWQLFLWAAALSLFGVFLAIPLRKSVVIEQRLRFPSGTATAELIAVLHQRPLLSHDAPISVDTRDDEPDEEGEADGRGILSRAEQASETAAASSGTEPTDTTPLKTAESKTLDTSEATAEGGAAAGRRMASGSGSGGDDDAVWIARWRLLGCSSASAVVVTVLMEFIPVVRNLPVAQWVALPPLITQIGWTVTPSLSYVGQGMIMGPRTATSMLLGSVMGWLCLALAAYSSGLAPGPVSDPHTGVRAWETWSALGVMLGDSAVTLVQAMVGTVSTLTAGCARRRAGGLTRPKSAAGSAAAPPTGRNESSPLAREEETALIHEEAGAGSGAAAAAAPRSRRIHAPSHAVYVDGFADPAELAGENVPASWVAVGAAVSCVLCSIALTALYQSPWYEPLVALLASGLVAVVAARALGETDLNPVSGVGKLSQLVFAAVAPGNVVSNLVAGAVAEAGAQQAGDLLQDLKTGHMVGASPRAQLVGQLVGTAVGIVVSVLSYTLLTSVYVIGGSELPVPTARVWLDMAILVNGGSLPAGALAAAGVCFVTAACVATLQAVRKRSHVGESGAGTRGGSCGAVVDGLPSMMAVGIGMYIAPNWVLPRAVGGLLAWQWKRQSPVSMERYMLLVASGFVLGEGLASIVNAVARAAGAMPWTCSGCVGALSCSGCP